MNNKTQLPVDLVNETAGISMAYQLKFDDFSQEDFENILALGYLHGKKEMYDMAENLFSRS